MQEKKGPEGLQTFTFFEGGGGGLIFKAWIMFSFIYGREVNSWQV